MNRAACVVVFNEIGELIGASRRDRPTEFGLPGGKIDIGESAKQAAKRELFEETGIDVLLFDLIPLYRGMDSLNYDVETFLCLRIIGRSKLRQMETGITIKWITMKVLLDGPFGEYNTHVMSALSKRGNLWKSITASTPC